MNSFLLVFGPLGQAPCGKGCHHALDNALITAPEARDPAVAAKLDSVAGRVLGG